MSSPNMADPEQIVDLAVLAERVGYDGVFLWDHLTYFDDRRPIVDPWVVLGAIAQATERVRLGTLVTPLARRRPWQVAKQVVALDHLSRGRAVLGVGLGFPAAGDFAAFGEPSDDRVRAELLDEGLDLVQALWSGKPVSHHGRHHHVEATLWPPPLQRPRPPVWVAAMWPNRRPVARAARFDGIVPLLDDHDRISLCRPDDVRAIVAEVRRTRPAEPFEVVLGPHWEHEPQEYEAAGATWLLTSWDAEPGWEAELRNLVEQGPPGSR